MAPISKRRASTAAKKEKWVAAEEIFPSKVTKATTLKRLEIEMKVEQLSETGSTETTVRRTRRMSVAPTSKIPRTTPKQVSKSIITESKKTTKVTKAKSTSNVGSSKSSNKTTAEAVSKESWIDQIKSPDIFYKSENIPTPLKGAKKRKSYASPVQSMIAEQSKKTRQR